MGNIMQGATLLKARACGEENGSMIRCALALTLTFSEYWLLNYSAFPLFDLIFNMDARGERVCWRGGACGHRRAFVLAAAPA